MDVRLGQQIGNYRLVKLLGKGAFAEVYLGQHIHLASKQAAIKILHLIGVDERKFKEEAETTEKLVHPHIVRLLDFAIEQGEPFLVLDYASGGSLRARHPKGSVVPLANVRAYLKEIAPALQYAHDQHILHRDIKPDNILLGRGGKLLLADFGVATLIQTGQSLKTTRSIAGTQLYMAPEAFRGKPEKASDQYSLAVVLYELLCGSPPFSVGDLGYQHNYEPVPPLREKNPAIHPDIEAVIMKALAKQPADRFTSVQSFAQAFEEALEQAFGSTLPSQPPQPDHRIPVRRTYYERHQDTSNTEQRIPYRPEPLGSFPSGFPFDEEEVEIPELYQSFSEEEGEEESPGRFRHTGVSSPQSFFYNEDELAILQRIRDDDIDPSWYMFYPTEDQFLRHSIQYYMKSRESESRGVYAAFSVAFALFLLVILAVVLGSGILFGVGCVLVLAIAGITIVALSWREAANSALIVTPDLFLWGNWKRLHVERSVFYQNYSYVASNEEQLTVVEKVYDFNLERTREKPGSISFPALFGPSRALTQTIADAHKQFQRSNQGNF